MPVKFRYLSSEGGSLPNARFTRDQPAAVLAPSPTQDKVVEGKGPRDLLADTREAEPVAGKVEDGEVDRAPFRTDETHAGDLPSPRGDKPQGCMESFLHAMCGVRPALSVVIAMDSFKGSMTSREAASVVEAALRAGRIERVFKLPMSDGGEGFIDSFRAICGEGFQMHRSSDILGPDGQLLLKSAAYLYDTTSDMAVIESASVVGFTMVPDAGRDPMRLTSFGLGQLIRKAIDEGARSIYVGVGGTATVDGGAGLAMALGVRFLDNKGVELTAADGNVLPRVSEIDLSQLDASVAGVDFVAAVDVNNALLGTEGAVSTYGPQKGVSAAQVPLLDHQMQKYASLVEAAVGATGLSMTPGTGSGGGIGFALAAFCQARLVPGFKVLAEKADLTTRIKKADIVITGEGKFDASSMHGKLPIEVARIARSQGTKCFLFTGKSEQDILDMPEEGISCILPLLDSRATAEDVAKAQANAKELLFKEVTRSLKLLRLGQEVRI